MSLSYTALSGTQWLPFDDVDNRADAIARENHISPLLSKALARLTPPLTPGKEVDDFLHPSMAQYLDPYLMLNMKKAVDKLEQAIANHTPIRIVTDYDVDGTMSSLILQAALRLRGHQVVSYHIPDRKIEGYGFSMQAAQKAIDDGIPLIVTADIGVRDEAAIAFAQSHGIDVIVLDHHIPEGGGVPPSAFAVVCPPQLGCTYPNAHLAACGVSLKLAQALLKDLPKYTQYIQSLSKLSALGTVADVVSLRSLENRAIVATGLDALNHYESNNPGIKALLNATRIQPGRVDAGKIAFNLGPIINAAGRMSTATLIIELLNAANRVKAQGLSDQLSMMNDARKTVQAFMLDEAKKSLKEDTAPFLCIANPECDTWMGSIAGIVAGRLREIFHKPVAVGTIEGGFVRGSIRSTPGVHAVTALDHAADLMVRYGGHKAAAGFTCAVDDFPEVKKRFSESASIQLDGKIEIETEEFIETFLPSDISKDIFDELDKLEPCGSQNPRPNVCIKNVRLSRIDENSNATYRALLKCNDLSLRLWLPASIGDHIAAILKQPVMLFGKLEKDYFNGEQYMMRVQDVSLSIEEKVI